MRNVRFDVSFPSYAGFNGLLELSRNDGRLIGTEKIFQFSRKLKTKNQLDVMKKDML